VWSLLRRRSAVLDPLFQHEPADFGLFYPGWHRAVHASMVLFAYEPNLSRWDNYESFDHFEFGPVDLYFDIMFFRGPVECFPIGFEVLDAFDDLLLSVVDLYRFHDDEGNTAYYRGPAKLRDDPVEDLLGKLRRGIGLAGHTCIFDPKPSM